MSVFSVLVCLSLKEDESFDQFVHNIELLIQYLIQCLRNWCPPVILREQLLLFCSLHALPAVPYGPVCHIIPTSPRITFSVGMGILKDVVNTGDELITNTL